VSQQERNRRFRVRHREDLNAKARAKYVENIEAETARRKKYRTENDDLIRARGRARDAMPDRKAYRQALEKTEKIKATRKAYRERFPLDPAYSKAYEATYHARRKELHHEKQKNDVQYRLRRTLRARLKRAIDGGYKTTSATILLGCSIEALLAHLERQWLPGMCWENFGRLDSEKQTWQIDHVLPLSGFDLTDTEQAAQACHFTNLAPLWAIDNRRKGSRPPVNVEVRYDV
jgi:hypothetical protein